MTSIPIDQNGDFSYCDAFGEPDILPRIGNEYQAQLPPHILEPDYRSHSKNCLPLPLTWINSPKHASPQNVSDSDPKGVNQTGTYSNGEENEACFLVPELPTETWSDAEKASLVLGLYIFEKNFVEVRRFIESKEMGTILCFYYGKFYGSNEYRRWSECKKSKSKKCVFGQRIFSGVRLQELLSRLVQRVPEDRKSALLEVSKTFGDEKISLVDYISSLKIIVGLNNLVEAVGVGMGKQDLTGMGLDPPKATQTGPARRGIPTGQACASLTTNEIIKFLSGDYRLSKTRSNDLFWEAVWPRLLARGWHSEQPKNQGYNSNINHCLVFLMPGVKKFSRRKLVKGDHYFDSVTEILSKVAKEPGLLKLDDEEVDGGNKNKDDHELTILRKLEEEDEEDDVPIKERYSYLQPRKTGNHGTDVMKFMVVDTGLSDGKIRELRTLPSEISNTFFISRDRIEDKDILEKKRDESVRDDRETRPVYPDISKNSCPIKKKKDSLKDDKKLRKVQNSSGLSRKQKRSNLDCVSPISKRCKRLTADHEMGPTLENGISSCFPGFKGFNEKKLSELISCHQDELSSLENTRSQPLTDLNLPQVPQEFEQDKLSMKEDKLLLQKNSGTDTVVNQRRHSTRNHNPTTRVLEAVANGYLTVNKKKRNRAGPTLHEDPKSKPLKHDLSEVGPTNESTEVLKFEKEEEAEQRGAVCNIGDDNMFIKFQAFPEMAE